MSKPKGGRGYKAPYETHQIRVPDPVAPQVHKLIENYQQYIADGGNPNQPPEFTENNKVVDRFREDIKILQDANLTLESIIQETNNAKNKAIKLLKNSLKLKANTGGAIKKEIQKALELLEIQF